MKRFLHIQARILLEQFGIEDVTPKIQAENEAIDEQSLAAAKRFSSRRPNLNFEEMSIPIGAILSAVNSADTVKVTGPKKVTFRDTEMSLTAATRIVLGIGYNVQPSPHWRYEDQLLRDISNRTYDQLDE